MLKIGDFSKLSQVPAKTLRYYDEIGLLKPGQTDRFSGYRYYSLDQLPRLNRILALKDLGFSLEQIAQALKDDLPAAQLRGMLRLRQAEAQQHVSEEQARLMRIEARLSQIEQENPMSNYDVVLKNMDAMTVASVRDTIPQYGEIDKLINELFAWLGQHGIQPNGAPFSVWHDHDFQENNVDAEFAVPVNAGLPEGERIKVYRLPSAQVACVIHHGPYETVSQAYTALGAWIESNGYKISGSNREVYLRGPESGSDPAAFVTEVMFPVEKV